MGILSKARSILSKARSVLRNFFGRKPPAAPPKPPEPPKQPPKPPVPPKPPKERFFEVVLYKSLTRGGKSKPGNKDRIELRVNVKAKDIDDARHTALRAIGSRVPDGYIQFFERVGLYKNISVSERSDAPDTITFLRHSSELRGKETW